ncbi:SRP-independent targeting protein 1-like [Lycium barbarum]|uniref:SRP-independent targeting protein 1-like n=1 Tax=Lycium barbarum TaxID=112863 RepID=UPI00293E0C05|nr:SRP-independent targeting protein 1-like [Lycium barbarum]
MDMQAVLDKNLPARALRIRNKNYQKRLKANRKNKQTKWMVKKMEKMDPQKQLQAEKDMQKGIQNQVVATILPHAMKNDTYTGHSGQPPADSPITVRNSFQQLDVDDTENENGEDPGDSSNGGKLTNMDVPVESLFPQQSNQEENITIRNNAQNSKSNPSTPTNQNKQDISIPVKAYERSTGKHKHISIDKMENSINKSKGRDSQCEKHTTKSTISAGFSMQSPDAKKKPPDTPPKHEFVQSKLSEMKGINLYVDLNCNEDIDVIITNSESDQEKNKKDSQHNTQEVLEDSSEYESSLGDARDDDDDDDEEFQEEEDYEECNSTNEDELLKTFAPRTVSHEQDSEDAITQQENKIIMSGNLSPRGTKGSMIDQTKNMADQGPVTRAKVKANQIGAISTNV